MHTAIIMDGNGRWATQRGLPRLEGHRRGALSVRRAIEAAPALGITDLTLYGFSSDNWARPHSEVTGLMDLFVRYLAEEAGNCYKKGVRLSVIGRRDRLDAALRELITDVEMRTHSCSLLHLRLAIDYSSRHSLIEAARTCLRAETFTDRDFARALPAPDVDLLIRTSGEQRLSDFLLWECAYAEFVFTDCLWPDFSGDDLCTAVSEFQKRARRFGALPAA
ncbi:MAG: di-trans,poly-cis-decaprenylcistransferase [Bryobacteraceae bacterium]|nr:di-trans,poly-cis-decaprenylcistransferase [Bryobacteraceae bacterium]